MPVKQNKGEWSEFYSFLKIIQEGELIVLDLESETNTTVVIKEATKGGVTFELIKGKIYQLTVDADGSSRTHTPVKHTMISLKDPVSNLFRAIRDGSKSFHHMESEILANEMGICVKSDHTHAKGDIGIRFVNSDTSTDSKNLEVSVKSWIGQDPTLLNASKNSTRVLFKITGLEESFISGLPTVPGIGKTPKEIVQLIYEHGGALEYHKFEHKMFSRNLKILRADDALAFSILEFYKKTDSGRCYLKWTCERKTNPDESIRLEITLKDLLRNVATGMTPSSAWNGELSASDNYIGVNSEGELFLINGRGKLENYLFQYSYFDTPSRKKHQYGHVIKYENEAYLVLNFQIRLSKPKKL